MFNLDLIKKPFNRKRKTKNPCLGCGLHLDRCICDAIPKLHLRTKICLVIHRKELKRTTNTGQLAIKSLVNSEMRVRGDNKIPLDLSDLLTPTYRTFLFFPSFDAVELTSELVQSSSVPIQLIVPDGNWRQASKVQSRHPELKNVQKIKIGSINPASLHLRTEHKPEGMATLEAIAQVLGIIEGPEIKKVLMDLYEKKLKNTLIGRGQK